MSGDWFSVKDELGPANVPLLAYYQTADGQDRIVRATLSGQHTLPLGVDLEGTACECGECEGEYVAAGVWYEKNEHEDTHWEIDETVTHWTYLPEPPRTRANCRGNETGTHTCGLPVGGCGVQA